MKKKGVSILLTLILLICPCIVNAASSCSYSEQAKLNDTVANVKASYEYIERLAAEKAIDPDSGEEMDDWEDLFKISIINITEDIYVTVSNSVTGFENTYKYENTNNGIIEFEQHDMSSVTEYEIKVYSNNVNCPGELYRTFTLKTPRYNEFSSIAICNNYPNYYYCQEFMDTDNEIDYEKFYDGLESYQELHPEEEQKEEMKEENKLIKFYKDHALVINIVAGVLVVGGVTATVILVKRKRSRVL